MTLHKQRRGCGYTQSALVQLGILHICELETRGQSDDERLAQRQDQLKRDQDLAEARVTEEI